LTDHDEIRRWAQERDAKPATVRRTHSGDNVGIIRLDFPGYSGAESLDAIEWDEWFDNFDENNLALVVQDTTAGGQQSNFNKLVSREHVSDDSEETSSKKSRRPRTNKTSARSANRSASVSAAKKHSSTKRASGSRTSGKKTTASENRRRTSGRKAA
jgi:hypothetical protein